MQLDTEDGETFVPPAGVMASPTAEQHEPVNGRGEEEDERPGARAEHDVAA